MRITNAIIVTFGWLIGFSVLFLLPLAAPIGLFMLLHPVGFLQLFMTTVLGIIMYFIALVVLWFGIYIFK